MNKRDKLLRDTSDASGKRKGEKKNRDQSLSHK